MIEGLASVDKSIDPNDYLHGVLRDDKATLLACRPPASQGKDALAAKFIPARRQAVVAGGGRPAEAAAHLLRAAAAANQNPTVGNLRWIGSNRSPGMDRGRHGPGLRAAATPFCGSACKTKGTNLIPVRALGQWIADRFAGVPAVGNC